MTAPRHPVDSADIVEGRSSQLFGYSTLLDNPLAALFTLQIVLRVQPALLDQEGTNACLYLVKAARTIKSNVRCQARYACTVATALSVLPAPYALAPACAALMKWPISDDDKWQNAVHAVLDILPGCDESLRLQIWSSVRAKSPDLHLVKGVCCDIIGFLLTPIEPSLPIYAIKDLLVPHVLERWFREVDELDTTTAVAVRQLLVAVDEGAPHSSRKRKRTDESDVSETERILLQRIPGLVISEKGLIKDLMTAAEEWVQLSTRADGHANSEQLARWSSTSIELFCILAGCRQHRSPVAQVLSEECFDLFAVLMNGFDSDSVTLRSFLTLLEHTLPVTLVTGLQFTSRRIIMEKTWSCLGSTDRRVRVLAG